jgi:hypothetical protein
MRISKSQPAHKIHYSEFQFPPLWHALLALLVTSSLGIAYASAVSTIWGWLLGLLLSALAFWWWFAKGVQILVTDVNLQIGKLIIEKKYIGAVSALPAEEFLQRIRGGAHRQDVFVLRNVNFGGVEIEIKDERDPFCHWVVTSKHPSRLATTILGRS